MSKQNISKVEGSMTEKIKRFGYLFPFAICWYLIRYLRQKCYYIFFKYFGKYAFRSIGKNVKIDGIPDILWPCADIKLEDNVRIGKRCVFQGAPDSKILIRKNVSVNDGCYITSMFNIVIGKNTSIGEYTSIRDYNHQFNDTSVLIKNQDYFGAPIKIGEDCWIGRGCIILPGVTIGDGTVIGANTVVNKSIPENCIAAGVPVKIIKKRGENNAKN